MLPVKGLHHITAVTKDPQKNIDFYQQVLGQRLVKTTVNFDDPGTYHLYYGDQVGSPGTALTFFGWLHVAAGMVGTGETGAMSYGIPAGSLSFWSARLKQMGLNPGRIESRFGQDVIPFADPDGMRLELIGIEERHDLPFWQEGPIAEEHALQGFNSVTFMLDEVESTAEVLGSVFGYQYIGQEGNRYRYAAQGDAHGGVVDLLLHPNGKPGRFGAGSIHHIAFRAADGEQQLAYRQAVQKLGIHTTQVIDRMYFQSVYFRTPGGVLFEIATDEPGFLIDEDVENMGSSLRLPPWYESKREEIEASLPPIERAWDRETADSYGD